MSNLTELEALVLDKLLRKLAINNGFTEQALVASVGTELRAATTGLSSSAVFQSAEITGDGTAQSTAHGLGATPRLVWATLTELPADLTAGADIAIGTHTSTNCVFTVTSGIKYRVYALL